MKKPKTIKITKRILTEDEADKTTALRRIMIKRDNDPLNPREHYDNLFTIYSGCRYVASDNGAYDPIEDYGRCPDDAKPKDGVCAFPFFAYVHSGMSLSMSPFADKWDSGCAGFIYVEKDKFCKKMGLKRFSRAKAYKIAEGEIETLDQYVNNEVFGFVEQTRKSPDDEWEDGESCWGFFGEDSIPDMLADAGADEEGTVICEDTDAYYGRSEVTMEIAKRSNVIEVA